ncbi:hypothetical protein ZOSMA_6G01890 [Zostera marina]|uniref:Phosphatidylinositol-4-phosphate 5-kinase n=1 Tax=Zostera marina TaxID=29655 RepID=A0A0K9NR59_ZOSMR|nr:hypothetical protein ZOSMA_6G01890 [Zostera marina]
MKISSSLLRSPTLRSITNFSAVDEQVENRRILTSTSDDEDDNSKTHKPTSSNYRPFSSLSRSPSSFLCCFCPSAHLALCPLLPIALFSLCFLFFFYRGQITISPVTFILPLSIVFVVYILVYKLHLFKFFTTKPNSRIEPVVWSIGDSNERKRDKRSNHSVGSVGVEFYGNGDCYEGEFHKGMPCGSGVCRYFGNGRYEGDWVDGRYDGYGIENWSRGSRYRGMYRKGLRHGFGVFQFYSGDNYTGEWFNGQSHGVGCQICVDGSCYVGYFMSGAKHGIGYYEFRNGDRYAGEYYGDKIHGFGVYCFKNGHSYKGSWHEGRKQGFGTYTFRNGETRSGEWNQGVLSNTCSPQFTDEAVDRAVQAARKVEANALMIPKVNPLLENALKSANHAANAARVAATKAVRERTIMKL